MRKVKLTEKAEGLRRMFDIEVFNSKVKEVVEDNSRLAVSEIRRSLSAEIYSGIIKNFNIKLGDDGDIRMSLSVKDDFLAENQDVIRVLAYGGVFKKKNGEFVGVPPNLILLRYLVG